MIYSCPVKYFSIKYSFRIYYSRHHSKQTLSEQNKERWRVLAEIYVSINLKLRQLYTAHETSFPWLKIWVPTTSVSDLHSVPNTYCLFPAQPWKKKETKKKKRKTKLFRNMLYNGTFLWEWRAHVLVTNSKKFLFKATKTFESIIIMAKEYEYTKIIEL